MIDELRKKGLLKKEEEQTDFNGLQRKISMDCNESHRYLKT